MTSVTHHAVLSDVVFSLTPGGDIDIDLDFILPDNTVTTQRGVLTFMVAATSADLRYSMTINGTQQVDRRVGSTVSHAEQEAVSGLRADQNTLQVRVTSGAGTLTFNDVVLFYVRDI